MEANGKSALRENAGRLSYSLFLEIFTVTHPFISHWCSRYVQSTDHDTVIITKPTMLKKNTYIYTNFLWLNGKFKVHMPSHNLSGLWVTILKTWNLRTKARDEGKKR